MELIPPDYSDYHLTWSFYLYRKYLEKLPGNCGIRFLGAWEALFYERANGIPIRIDLNFKNASIIHNLLKGEIQHSLPYSTLQPTAKIVTISRLDHKNKDIAFVRVEYKSRMHNDLRWSLVNMPLDVWKKICDYAKEWYIDPNECTYGR